MKVFELLVCFALFYSCFSARAQGTFQNLNFENANLSPIPSGQFGSAVSITDALPGWNGYLGTNETTGVLQNNSTLGSASIDILGPNWASGGIIEGQYTVLLQFGRGLSGIPGDNVYAAISQVGLVPATARSILYYSGTPSSSVAPISVLFASQQIPVAVVASTATFTIYGGDVSAFAGQTGALRFEGNGFLDAIQFSAQQIPEPGTFGLFGLGGLLLVWRFLCKRS